MDAIIEVPTVFWNDHYDRCGEIGEVTIIKRGAKLTTVQLDQAAWDDLLSDAQHYAYPGQYGREYFGLVTSAKATVRRMTAVQ